MEESWLTSSCPPEFAGTLLGFDDYVSKYIRLVRAVIVLGLRVIRYGSGRCDGVVSFAKSLSYVQGSARAD